ncbi:MAG: TrmH family RNA methyltransferase [Candidatus Levybacteria bacterium]|nr:TrmH family RNA methyltransferase [Candidatus Levybacteria bacterium]
MIKLGAAELRTTSSTDAERKNIKRNPIYIILDNVMDTYNIGSIFRLADAVAAEKVILCGETETPPHTRIKKASINTTEWVAWEYLPTVAGAIKDLRSKIKDLKVIAIEQDNRSVVYDKANYDFPVALVVGHETTGVSKSALQICDQIVEIPMWGVNKSLNVVVSLGIVLFEAMKSA